MENDEDKKDKKGSVRTKLTEGITYVTCPVHAVTYPKGASCPKCLKNKE